MIIVIYLNYSTVYNIIVLSVICNILYMNFKNTTNCISCNDHHIDCTLKWKKYSTVFYAKGSESDKSSYQVTISG